MDLTEGSKPGWFPARLKCGPLEFVQHVPYAGCSAEAITDPSGGSALDFF